jgi:hypothetical protein
MLPTVFWGPEGGLVTMSTSIGERVVEATSEKTMPPIRVGTGACKLCDCPSYIANLSPSSQCVNLNSAGGTCNHWDYEHS